MKISLNWIREFVDLPFISPEQLAQKVSTHTAEVEGIVDEAKNYAKMVIGKVLSIKKHPSADRLHLVETDIGKKTVQMVCGGQNLYIGMLVAVAMPGAFVRWHGEGDPVELKEVTIRRESSYGMICAGEEIGLPPDNTSGSKEVHIHDLNYTGAKPGTALAKALHKEDVLLDIDNKSLTHRPDLWGHYGFAREMAAIFGKKLKSLDQFLTMKSTVGKEKISVKIEDNKMCPRFSACMVKGIKIEASPQWMKARLQAAGMNVHNNVVDITNYVMLELGQPLHAYDRRMVGDDGFRVRYAKKGETLVTLDESEQKLSEEDPLVCNAHGEPLGLAGIKGGLKSGIRDNTSEIILESANFEPVVVRKSSLRHLRTEASQRFEKSLDPSLTEVALKRAVHLLQELCPSAQLISPIITVGTWKARKTKIDIDTKEINKKIGTTISTKEMVHILKSLEFEVKTRGQKLTVRVPSHRATCDVNITEDIVEEVARIYGYNRIPTIRPVKPLMLPQENKASRERFYKHRLREILALGLGFTEVVNYSFYSKEIMRKCGLAEEKHLKILNYLSEDQTHLRLSMIPPILKTLAKNTRAFEITRIFEFGRTYEETGAFMPREEKRLIAAVAQKNEAFYTIKGALYGLLETFRSPTYELKPSGSIPPYAHPKKCVDIIMKGENIGQLFTVHPGVTFAFDLEQSVGIFEINFNTLARWGRQTKHYEPLAKFPSMVFDISVLVNKTSTVAELEKLIQSSDPLGLIRSVQLFDIYEGENIPEGEKSLTFHVELRHDERTLTEKEFQAVQESCFLALTRFGAKIRGNTAA